jgi:L-amino acid N-acyltransferase YncA
LLLRIPSKPIDINCVHFLEHTGIPSGKTSFRRGRGEIRGATMDDLNGITTLQNTPQAFVRRFQSNDYCAVAIVDGHIVGYEWFCVKPFHMEERYSYKIEIPPDAIYAYDAFILPEHRLAGIWLKFQTIYLRQLMQALGKQKVVTMIDHGNRLSMSTHLRFGFRVVGRVYVVKLFGKSFFLIKHSSGGKLARPDRMSLAGTLERGEAKEL